MKPLSALACALLSACAPRIEAARVDLPAPTCATAEPAPLASDSPARPMPGLATLTADPARIWLYDEASGLGGSYSLSARLLHIGAIYEGDCTLSITAVDAQGISVSKRSEEKQVNVPTERVRAFTEAIRHAGTKRRQPGLVRLEGLDEHSAGDIMLFYRDREAPLYVNLEAGAYFSIYKDGLYDVVDNKRVSTAYRALLGALDLDRWVEALSRAALGAKGP